MSKETFSAYALVALFYLLGDLAFGAEDPSSPFLGPAVHNVIVKCAPTALEIRTMDQPSRDWQIESEVL